MRTTGCSWALKGLGLGLVGLVTPEVAWATTCPSTAIVVNAGKSLAQTFAEGGTGLVEVSGDGTKITLRSDTELCFDEGWSDPSGLTCLEVAGANKLTVTVDDSNEDKTTGTISLPGLYVSEPGGGSFVEVTNATIVGECASASTGGPSARLLVEGAHTVTLTDTSLTGDKLYGLFATAGTLSVLFADDYDGAPFADSFDGFPAVKLTTSAVTYTQTGGTISNTTDASALKSYAARVMLTDVEFLNNQGELDSAGASNSGGALQINGGSLSVTGGSFTDNRASKGGAIWGDTKANLTLNGVTFNNNSAKEYGGAVGANDVTTLVVMGGTSFTDDNANYGGAIAFHASFSLSVEEASFTSTTAVHAGGAIYAGTGLSKIGNEAGTPSFVSTSAPSGGAIAFASPTFESKVIGATFEDIQGDVAIDVKSAAYVLLSGLSSPNGLGQFGLLRSTDSSVALIGSTITGIDGSGASTLLVADQALIDVSGGVFELSQSQLCGFIAQGDAQPIVKLTNLTSSAGINNSTFMNLGGTGEPHRVIEIDTPESIYLFNNTFVGQTGGAQVAVYAEVVGGIRFYNNLFHQLSAGLIVETIGTSSVPFVSHNLYSPTVDATVVFPPENTIDGLDTLIGKDPLFVRSFDTTRCSVWPYVTVGSAAVGDDVGVQYDGVGLTTQIGAWGALIDGDPAAVDTDQDDHSIIDDCDDANAAIYPGAPEDPDNGVDDDCDGEVDEFVPDTGDDTGDDDTGDDDTGDDDTGLEVRPDADGDGVPDDDDCAPDDDDLTDDCPSRFVYSGGRLGCAAAPVEVSALGLLVVALAGARRRRPTSLV